MTTLKRFSADYDSIMSVADITSEPVITSEDAKKCSFSWEEVLSMLEGEISVRNVNKYLHIYYKQFKKAGQFSSQCKFMTSLVCTTL